MAIEYGVTINGFVIKTLDIVKSETNDDLKEIIGNQINLLPEAVFGSIRDKFSERLHEMWELFQLLYNAAYPNTSEGVSLDNVCDFSAIERLEAAESTITSQALFGSATTLIEAGTQVAVLNDSSTVFETDEDVTLVVGVDEVQNISFDITPTGGTITFKYNEEETIALDFDMTNIELQDALNALDSLSEISVTGTVASDFVVTFAGNDGKQPQPLLTVGTNSLTPATVLSITETTPGEYQGTVSMTCIETGVKTANAGTLTVIVSPISGFTGTFNINDAIVGRDIETDAELRIRRAANVVTSRNGPIDAIKNRILDLNGDEYADLPQLTDVIVYENDTDFANYYGRNMDGHSVMAVVRQEGDVDSRDQEISDTILLSKAGGIGTSFGLATGGNAVTKISYDSSGIPHTIYFARPSAVTIYLIIDNLVTTAAYPATGDDQLKTLLVLWGNALGVGGDIIIYPTLISQMAAIPGITDFEIKIGIAPAPTLDDNIIISNGIASTPEFSSWSTTNITINHAP